MSIPLEPLQEHVSGGSGIVFDWKASSKKITKRGDYCFTPCAARFDFQHGSLRCPERSDIQNRLRIGCLVTVMQRDTSRELASNPRNLRTRHEVQSVLGLHLQGVAACRV